MNFPNNNRSQQGAPLFPTLPTNSQQNTSSLPNNNRLFSNSNNNMQSN